MCQWSEKSSIEIDLVTTNADGQGVLDVPLDQWTDYQGINTRFFNRDFSESFKYSFGISSWLKRNVKNYDLVHIHAVFSHASIAAAQACKASNTPYIIRPLGTLDPWSVSQKSFRKQLFLKAAVKNLLNSACAIQYTSDMEKQTTESFHGLERGVVIPNGIDVQGYESETGDDNRFQIEFPELKSNSYLLFMGRIAEKKNIASLLEAFARVKQEKNLENLQLVIAGEGDLGFMKQIRELATANPNNDQIHWTGWATGKSKQLLYQNAKLFVLPSMNENYGIVVAESLASGVPVLISDQVYLYPEVEKSKCGWVWNKGGSLGDSLADSLLEALNSNELKIRGARGTELVNTKYNWPVVISKLKQIYDQNTLGSAKDQAE